MISKNKYANVADGTSMPRGAEIKQWLMQYAELCIALRRSWSVQTCYPPLRASWTAELPEIGQCAVTALLVQENFGGEILFCEHTNHYWNHVPYLSGREPGMFIDLTSAQFPEDVSPCCDRVRTRDNILYGSGAAEADTLARYRLLKSLVFDSQKGGTHV